MSLLLEKQQRFTVMIAKLILWADEHGYKLTFGEAFRPQITADAYAKQGKGIKATLHAERLAVDFNLFKDGKYLQASADHKPLGLYWESIGGTWGGRFNDGNHYSLTHNGIK